MVRDRHSMHVRVGTSYIQYIREHPGSHFLLHSLQMQSTLLALLMLSHPNTNTHSLNIYRLCYPPRCLVSTEMEKEEVNRKEEMRVATDRPDPSHFSHPSIHRKVAVFASVEADFPVSNGIRKRTVGLQRINATH